jgi:hypothetical protein
LGEQVSDLFYGQRLLSPKKGRGAGSGHQCPGVERQSQKSKRRTTKMAEEKTFWEQNIALWEKWTSAYTDSMFKAMEKAMEQSTAFRDQIDKAANSAVNAQMQVMLTAIKSLEKQVETLSAQVDKLLKEKK